MAKSFKQLADEYFQSKLQVERAEKIMYAARDAILATGREELFGSLATVTVSLQVRQSLDTAAVKAFLTPHQVSLCTKETTSRVVRVKATTATEAAA